jgi:predicted nuclease of predicted toxin-antitoxin system
MMRFKIDENLHDDVAEVLRTRGHDAQTVLDEGLRGRPAPEIAEAASREGRALITLDLDFGNVREYPPDQYRGLIVLRVADPSRRHVSRVMERVVAVLDTVPLDGHLWIVSEGGIRVRPGSSAGGGGA